MRSEPTSMKPSWPWPVLSSAGTCSKGTAEKRSGKRTVCIVSARPKAEGELLVFHRFSVSVRGLMVDGFAAQRLRLRGHLSIGVVRRRSGQQRTRSFAPKIAIEKRSHVISYGSHSFVRSHGAGLDRPLRQPHCVRGRKMLCAAQVDGESRAKQIAPQLAFVFAPMFAPHIQYHYGCCGGAKGRVSQVGIQQDGRLEARILLHS